MSWFGFTDDTCLYVPVKADNQFHSIKVPASEKKEIP